MSKKSEKIEAEARDWVITLSDEDINGEKLQAFHTWRSADPRHETAFQDVDRIWRGMSTLSHLRRYAVLPEKPSSLATRVKNWWASGNTQWMTAGVGLAMAVLLAVVVVLPNYTEFDSYSTSIAEVRHIKLEDGSEVTLGAKSKIKVQYLAQLRRIELLEGDALFDVTHNPAQPFVVLTGQTQTRVLGTQFTVERDPHQVSVAVKEGKVQVGLSADDDDLAESSQDSGKKLTAGQAVVANLAGKVGDISTVNINTIGSWTEGRISYENTTLRAVIDDVNRYRRGDIQIADDATAGLRVSIAFRTDNVEQMIENLAQVLDLNIKRNLMGTIILQQRNK